MTMPTPGGSCEGPSECGRGMRTSSSCPYWATSPLTVSTRALNSSSSTSSSRVTMPANRTTVPRPPPIAVGERLRERPRDGDWPRAPLVPPPGLLSDPLSLSDARAVKLI
eukprot:CAMPEP_0119102768 /NCGR_PEP_ID=MMETSP1180-20130426/1392_1 /TAXON_ID=3052 ORGANISM="Chlamydomonas cf sp, Strain CCMP681" /NCGR_SAMPLE_ID=MMETSP1180 /ASSEMBLY_ACC=CAM_ASM_000741 /LENGTH=109 /DNA_ID=CAMNT_0007087103 /DNA_START=392 /DNA_END=721 /DNA_ORIENTATION=+